MRYAKGRARIKRAEIVNKRRNVQRSRVEGAHGNTSTERKEAAMSPRHKSLWCCFPRCTPATSARTSTISNQSASKGSNGAHTYALSHYADDRREDGEGTSSAGGTPSWTTLTPAAFKQILMELHESLDDNRGGMCSHVVEELTNCVVFGKLLT